MPSNWPAIYLVERDLPNDPLYRSTAMAIHSPGGTLIATGGQGAYVTVGADHAIYVFWYSGTSLQMRKSTNLGVSFGSTINVATGLPTTTNGDLGLVGVNNGEVTPRPIRTNSFIQVAANPFSPRNRYATYANKGAGTDKADVFFVTSTNGGVSWSTPLKVNDDATTTDQWNPTIAVAIEGGQLAIFYYSRQDVRSRPMATRSTISSNSTVTRHDEWHYRAFGPWHAVSDRVGSGSWPRQRRRRVTWATTSKRKCRQRIPRRLVGQPFRPWGGARMDPNVQYDKLTPVHRHRIDARRQCRRRRAYSFSIVTRSIFQTSLQPSDFKVNGIRQRACRTCGNPECPSPSQRRR